MFTSLSNRIYPVLEVFDSAKSPDPKLFCNFTLRFTPENLRDRHRRARLKVPFSYMPPESLSRDNQ